MKIKKLHYPSGNTLNGYGFYQWHELEVGEGIMVPLGPPRKDKPSIRSRFSAWILKKRFPGTDWTTTVVGVPDGQLAVVRTA